jgi:hypothetical protein
MHKTASILSFFSRRTTEGGASMPPLMEDSASDCPLNTEPSSDCALNKETETSSHATLEQSSSDCALTPSIQEDTTLCSEGPTVQLTAKQRKAHQRFGIEIKAATGLDLLSAPSNNGRLTSQCATCLKANNETFKRNVKEKWVNHAKTCPGLILLREKSLLAPAQLSAEAQALRMHVTASICKHGKT